MAARKKHAKTASPEPLKRAPELDGAGDYVEFPCIPVGQGRLSLVVMSVRADLLWSLVSINRRDPDKNQGYQRALSGSRIDAIARYLRKGNPLPTSLIVSFDDAQLTGTGFVRVPNRPDAGWIIDGQHRLAGAHKSELEVELAVVAFLNLPLIQQIEQFVTINRETKGVPTSLYYDLLKHLPQEKSEPERARERAADLATQLRLDEGSAFAGKIVILGAPRRGEVSLNNFVRKISGLVHPTKGKLSLYTALEQKKIIDNYYKGLAHAFPGQYDRTDSIFFQTLGFGALINALPTAFDLAIKVYQGFAVEDVAMLFKKIDYFDFEQWRQFGTGNAAEMEAGNNLRQELLDSFAEGDSEDGGSIRL